ncbi:MAG: hypothetical protein QOE53_2473 [Pseudonocardiales bacterium]|nr:hypothetical protein [Pseudonocardiales bacterium]
METEIDQAGLPDLPTADAEQLPPDEGDAGAEAGPVAGDTRGPGDTHGREALAAAARLTPQQRASAQAVVLKGARLLLEHAAQVHYTMGEQRWEGINDKRYVRDGQFLRYGDCSSTATWLLWNALFAHLGMGDVVNGAGWRAGYTGTMLDHGRPVPESAVEVGDLVIYGAGAPGKHVTVCLGGGMVFSHGSDPGPYKLPLRYRSDVLSIRRYF